MFTGTHISEKTKYEKYKKIKEVKRHVLPSLSLSLSLSLSQLLLTKNVSGARENFSRLPRTYMVL
jgi:hypothetical protein